MSGQYFIRLKAVLVAARRQKSASSAPNILPTNPEVGALLPVTA